MVGVEARDLGVLQCHLSGGEPLQRRDVVEITQTANDLCMFTNLITSALGFSECRAEELKTVGLDHVQISIQADEQDRTGGWRSSTCLPTTTAIAPSPVWTVGLDANSP